MFKEYPRKLADVIVNNNLVYLPSARQLPEAKEVEKLYKELWGKIGPPDPPILESCDSGGFIHEYFPPIITEEISERIKKIMNKTAAGPNGLQKKQLSIRGLPKYWYYYSISYVLPLTFRGGGEKIGPC